MNKHRSRFALTTLFLFVMLAFAVAPTWAQGDAQSDPALRLRNAPSVATGSVELGPIVGDGSFETGSPNAEWEEFSQNFGTPLCTVAGCGTGTGTGPRTGEWWSWFGGIASAETGAVTQTVTIPSGSAELAFWLQIPAGAVGQPGFMAVRVDGDELFRVTQTSTGYGSYTEVTVDVSAYADGGAHELSFYSETQAGASATNFFVDDVSISSEAGGEGITLDKTVGTDPSVCATTDTITVEAGTEVTYCYEVTNNSEVTLSLHNLEDDQLGTVLANFPYELGPGASVFVTETDNITTDTTNIATWTAFNPVSYDVETGSCEVFPDISATGTALDLADDGIATVTLPFSFQLFDNSSNILSINNNGLLALGELAPGLYFSNEPLPTGSVPYGIMPFWDDLINFTAGGNQYAGVYTPTLAIRDDNGNLLDFGGGQIFAVQWDGLDHFDTDPVTGEQTGTPSEVTFTTLLVGPGSKGAGTIITCYDDLDFDDPEFDFGVSATIGLNQGADNALQYSFDTAQPELEALTFFPTGGGESYSDSDSATVNTVAPDINVTPASIAENHATPPTSTNRTLTIGNTGDSTLNWTIYEDSTRPTIPTVSRPVAPIAPETAHSAGHAPVDRPKTVTGNYAPPIVNLGVAIPAYSYRFTFEGTDIVQFPDILTPGTQVSIAPNVRSLFSGDFVAGDFTTLYAIDSDTNQFVAIDTSDGTETVLGTSTPAGGESWSGLSYDATTNTLYGSATSCASSTLYEIDPTDGTATAIGAVAAAGCLIDIAVSPDGDMYGIDIIADATLAINKDTGAGTVLGSTGIDANFAQGLDFDDASGVLYYAAFNNATFNGELRTVDLTSGATTLVGPFGADTTEIDAFAIATGGSPRCDGPDDISWLSLSSTSGSTAPGGSSNVTVTFNSASLANGVYTGTLCVESNDFDELLTRVPVTLTVGPPTAITLTDMNIGAGGIPMVAFAAAGGLLLAVAGLLLRKREE